MSWSEIFKFHLFLFTVLALGAVVHRAHSDVDNKIIGGVVTRPKQFPYQVSLQWDYQKIIFKKRPFHFCGGSLITKQWILTAAHCNVKVSWFGVMKAMVGEFNLTNADDMQSPRQVREVIKFLAHENYPGGDHVAPYDIGVAKVKEPFYLNDFVKIVKLPANAVIPSGYAIVTGWGSTSRTYVPRYTNILLKAVVGLVNLKDCRRIWGNNTHILDSNLCAGDLDGKRNVCSGDSGGPLVQKDSSGNRVQIGIVSFGIVPCGRTNSPAIYTRVSAYMSWIPKQIEYN